MTSIIVGVLCAITFMHDHRDIDERDMDASDREFYHELWVDPDNSHGGPRPMRIVDRGPSKISELKWWEDGPCPPCELIKMTTYTPASDQRSAFSDNACPTPSKPPELCQ